MHGVVIKYRQNKRDFVEEIEKKTAPTHQSENYRASARRARTRPSVRKLQNDAMESPSAHFSRTLPVRPFVSLRPVVVASAMWR
jgi:hypothetical protein